MTLIPTAKDLKILGVTSDPKFNYSEHLTKTEEKANKSLNIMKSLTSTKWGRQKNHSSQHIKQSQDLYLNMPVPSGCV